jgi:hypothetical protein
VVALEAAMESVETQSQADIWRVQLATGGSRTMTLDELDEAFQNGDIDEGTPVLPPGSTNWVRLADAAGLDAPSAEPAPSLAPVAVSAAPLPPDTTRNVQSSTDVAPEIPPPPVDLSTLDDNAFKSNKGKRFAMIGGIAAVILGLGAFGAIKLGAAASTVGPSPLLKGYANAPQAAEELPAPAFKPAALTEDQKRKLQEADKARKAKQPVNTGGAQPNGASHQKGSAPFVNSGDKYDPLNGNL